MRNNLLYNAFQIIAWIDILQYEIDGGYVSAQDVWEKWSAACTQNSDVDLQYIQYIFEQFNKTGLFMHRVDPNGIQSVKFY